jgi:antitoxin (DNA-binding transcriptional repressor) of toxin-antitoxin stability system
VKSATRQGHNDVRDLTATEFKKAFGQTLEQAFRGQRVRITRHGRTGERLVIIREEDLSRVEARAASPLDALRAEFDQMVERMQSPAARKAAASVGTASAAELGEAAVKGFTAGG